jgi:transcriptional/translational regulatory protein YebC/TACO1
MHADIDLLVANSEELLQLQDLATSLQLSGSSSLAYIPLELVKVSEEDREKNKLLIEEFEDLEDVDVVYHNMQLD